MSNKLVLLVVGAVLGAAVALLGAAILGGDGPDAASPAGETAELTARNLDLTRQVEDLSGQVERLSAEVKSLREAPEPTDVAAPVDVPVPDLPATTVPDEVKPEGPATKDEVMAAIRELGGAFNQIMTGEAEEAVKRLQSVFDRADAGQIAELLEAYSETGDIGQKVVLAHALAQSGRPDALEGLKQLVLDRTSNFDDRRYVAHALAFIDDESIEPVLMDVARSDPDRGARANAAFGIARRGNDEGIELYAAATDEAFRENDPIALQYLSGFGMLGKRALPAVRKRLDTYKETQTRLVLIELVRSGKDRDSLPVLHRLVSDPQADPAVQTAARKAITSIESDE